MEGQEPRFMGFFVVAGWFSILSFRVQTGLVFERNSRRLESLSRVAYVALIAALLSGSELEMRCFAQTH